MLQNPGRTVDRIDSFISNPHAGTLTGERRMGAERLLDMLADRLAEDDSRNVIRITENNDIIGLIRSKMRYDKEGHVIIYFDLDADETDVLLRTFPDTQIYRAKEICHQVPVCFREPAAGHDLCGCLR
ncbi:MAG: hypothetical protein LBV13_04400 [Methanomassiliicoccaceae archaeon]|nr:hypothetical protein [Methanomassiliicoccaceae archaeon]